MLEKIPALRIVPTKEWYLQEGWQALNDLLANLDTKNVTVVYVENFTVIQQALRKVSRKELVQLFNADSISCDLNIDSDGVLYAKKK